MPKGPEGEKRPADVVADAVKVMKLATGEKLGQTLIDTCQGSPHRDVEIAPVRMAAPVRDVTL